MKIPLEGAKMIQIRTQGIKVDADSFLLFLYPFIRVAESRQIKQIQQNTVFLLSGKVRFDEKGATLPFDGNIAAFPADRLRGGAVREKTAHGKKTNLDPVRRREFRMFVTGGDADLLFMIRM